MVRLHIRCRSHDVTQARTRVFPQCCYLCSKHLKHYIFVNMFKYCNSPIPCHLGWHENKIYCHLLSFTVITVITVITGCYAAGSRTLCEYAYSPFAKLNTWIASQCKSAWTDSRVRQRFVELEMYALCVRGKWRQTCTTRTFLHGLDLREGNYLKLIKRGGNSGTIHNMKS